MIFCCEKCAKSTGVMTRVSYMPGEEVPGRVRCPRCTEVMVRQANNPYRGEKR